MLLESHEGFYVVAEAADGREAVALAEQHHPDVVVMDLAMPILNGIEAARQICSSGTQSAIVFLSMHSDEATMTLGPFSPVVSASRSVSRMAPTS